MKKLISALLFVFSFQLLANCEIITPDQFSYLKEDMNKGSICREFLYDLKTKTENAKVQDIKITVKEVETFKVYYQFSAKTSLGELSGAGTHFWYPGDSFANIEIQ